MPSQLKVQKYTLFAIALLVYRTKNDGVIWNINLKSGFALCPNRETALSEAYQLLRSKYPQSKGWKYRVSCVELSEEIKENWLKVQTEKSSP